jgi:hypothetical protein
MHNLQLFPKKNGINTFWLQKRSLLMNDWCPMRIMIDELDVVRIATLPEQNREFTKAKGVYRVSANFSP